MPTVTNIIAAESASESAALHGHKAKTPIITGIVSGACVIAIWTVSLIVYLWRRRQRLKQARAAGLKSHRELLDEPKNPQAFIIPPDPAIIQGEMVPGQRVVVEDATAHRGHAMHPHANSEPIHRTHHARTGTDGLPPIGHTASAPPVLGVRRESEPESTSTIDNEKAIRPEMYEQTRRTST